MINTIIKDSISNLVENVRSMDSYDFRDFKATAYIESCTSLYTDSLNRLQTDRLQREGQPRIIVI